LEGRGPRLTLIGAIDDATGEVPYALFRLEEDAQGYFLLLQHIVATHGPSQGEGYRDRHSIFETPPRQKESLEEQLVGKREPTQFGRLLEELGITSIPSYSPQARGRIERLWGTFQDRLISELRLAGAQSIAQANQVIKTSCHATIADLRYQPLSPGQPIGYPYRASSPRRSSASSINALLVRILLGKDRALQIPLPVNPAWDGQTQLRTRQGNSA